MPLASFHDLMADAKRGHYAVGYFECWNLESLMAVADAAENVSSPVILGVSGIYLPHPARKVHDPLSQYAALGLDICRRLSVPACLMFNESPHMDWVQSALEQGFNLVKFQDHGFTPEIQIQIMQGLVGCAHQTGAAVEADLQTNASTAGDRCIDPIAGAPLTDPATAEPFVLQTGIDALTVNVCQPHYNGRRTVHLDKPRLEELADLPVPLVLQDASCVERDELQEAATLGIRKINVTHPLKQVYLHALRQACEQIASNDNPDEVIGSGLANDVLVPARLAMQDAVEDWMVLFGSAGRVEHRSAGVPKSAVPVPALEAQPAVI